MKTRALVTGILAIAIILSVGMALAQEVEYEVIESEPGEQGAKRVEIHRVLTPGMEGPEWGPGMMHGMMGGVQYGPGMMQGMVDMPRRGMHGLLGAQGMMAGPCGSGCGMMGCRCGMPYGTGGNMMTSRVMRAPGTGCGMGCWADEGGMAFGLHGKLSKLGCICQYEKHAKTLELSKEQLASLKELRVASKKAAIQALADIQIAHVELDEILGGCCPDLAKVKAKVSEIASLREDMALARITVLQKAQKILTKEQLSEFKKCMKGICGKTPECSKKKVYDKEKMKTIKRTEMKPGEKKVMKKEIIEKEE